MQTQPANYQSSNFVKQAAEFERQHGNIGTPESAAELMNTRVPERFAPTWTAWRSSEEFDSKFGGRNA